LDPEYLTLKCQLDFCVSSRNYAVMTAPMTWTCKRHEPIVGTPVDWSVISDPETGDDAYLYSGVTYRVMFRTPTVRCTFYGYHDVNSPLKWRVIFKNEEGSVVDIAADAITDIVAV
jgi:hypothetical protein